MQSTNLSPSLNPDGDPIRLEAYQIAKRTSFVELLERPATSDQAIRFISRARKLLETAGDQTDIPLYQSLLELERSLGGDRIGLAFKRGVAVYETVPSTALARLSRNFGVTAAAMAVAEKLDLFPFLALRVLREDAKSLIRKVIGALRAAGDNSEDTASLLWDLTRLRSLLS